MPPLVCVGLSHRTAPLAVRERFAVSGSRAQAVLATTDLRVVGRQLGFEELALLSTCNRTEVYAALSDPMRGVSDLPQDPSGLLASICHAPTGLDGATVYHKSGAAALRHLCLVASGLDSLVPGESEVLSQVDEARHVSAAAGSAGPVLDAVFRTAIRAGRRARAETQIGQLPASVASEAIRWICTRLDVPIATARVLLVGTGRVARVAGEILRDAGVRHLDIVGRSCDSTHELGEQLGATPLPWHGLAAGIQGADVVLATTAAPHAVISLGLVVDVLRTRSIGRRLLIADLAVPRDVEPGVGGLAGVEVLDLDGLQVRLEANMAERLREAPRVHAIIDEELAHFEVWQASVRLRPVLTQLHQRAEVIRQREVDRWLARSPSVDAATREAVESLSRAVIAKLLSGPSRRLRATGDRAQLHALADALSELFELGRGDGNGDHAVRD